MRSSQRPCATTCRSADAMRACVLSIATLVVAVLWPCPWTAHAGSEPMRIDVADDRGRHLRLAHVPERLITLLPSLTETVCDLGGCARLVGTDRYSNWPASVQTLPKLGGLEDASLEQIVGLRPDVVLAAASSRVIGRLEDLGVPVLTFETATLADMRRVYRAIAHLLDTPAVGEAALQRLDQRLSAARAAIPAHMRGRSVYFEVADAPYAAGSASFIGELLATLGLSNVVPATLGPFPKLNPEFVVRAQPSIIMATQRDVAGMVARPGWDRLRALSAGQTCGFPMDRFDILVRPGPRLGEAAEILASCVRRLDDERHR